MLKHKIASVLLLLLLLLVGCSVGGEVPPPEEDVTPTYNDPTHQSGAYRVTYTFGPNTVVHYYDEGELPDPPTFENYRYDGYYLVLTGWREPLVPVTSDAAYTATYETHRDTYTATFITPYGKTEVTAYCLDKPEPPKTDVGISDFLKNGNAFLSRLAIINDANTTASRAISPHVLDSQKCTIVALLYIFVAVVDVHVFQGVVALVSLYLVSFVIGVEV